MILRQPHRHDVARALDAEPQRRGSVELAFVVLRPPHARAGVDLERRIEHDGGRRIAVVERGGVDQRLERGAGLPQRLGGAVELALVEREAADHREHAAGVRIERDDAAGDFGHLAQPELPVPAVDRIDIDHVADFQHLRDAGRHAAARWAGRGLRPAHALKRDRAVVALLDQRAARLARRLEADARALVVDLEHDREPPGLRCR